MGVEKSSKGQVRTFKQGASRASIKEDKGESVLKHYAHYAAVLRIISEYEDTRQKVISPIIL